MGKTRGHGSRRGGYRGRGRGRSGGGGGDSDEDEVEPQRGLGEQRAGNCVQPQQAWLLLYDVGTRHL
jgi:hypothetical protein